MDEPTLPEKNERWGVTIVDRSKACILALNQLSFVLQLGVWDRPAHFGMDMNRSLASKLVPSLSLHILTGQSKVCPPKRLTRWPRPATGINTNSSTLANHPWPGPKIFMGMPNWASPGTAWGPAQLQPRISSPSKKTYLLENVSNIFF